MVGFDYRDERSDRSSTGLVKEERYHVPFLLDREAGRWRLDLSLWLHDLHQNVTAFHEGLRDSITDEQRAAVYASRTCGSGCRAIPMRLVASRSTRVRSSAASDVYKRQPQESP